MARFGRKMYPTSMGLSMSKNGLRVSKFMRDSVWGTYCHSRKSTLNYTLQRYYEKTSTYYDDKRRRDGVPSWSRAGS